MPLLTIHHKTEHDRKRHEQEALGDPGESTGVEACDKELETEDS
ncbi:MULTISPECIES: hypothetical protein [Bradyrhizobium]|nr:MULTISPECIES: hypothetical protein [Bradyrhizobium]